jgi:hypothetical protein
VIHSLRWDFQLTSVANTLVYPSSKVQQEKQQSPNQSGPPTLFFFFDIWIGWLPNKRRSMGIQDHTRYMIAKATVHHRYPLFHKGINKIIRISCPF